MNQLKKNDLHVNICILTAPAGWEQVSFVCALVGVNSAIACSGVVSVF